MSKQVAVESKDINTLNLRLSEGYTIVAHYGNFVLLAKQGHENE